MPDYTKRERLEKLVTDMRAKADELDASNEPPSAEDLKTLNDMGADVRELVDGIKAQATASGTLDVANAFLGDLAGDSTKAQAKAPAMVDGIVNPQGMTLGEAFVKSPAYGDFVDQFRGSDGRIRDIKGLKSGQLDVPGFDSKTLVTGVSATQGGAFVQNALLGQTVDLIGQRELTIRDLVTVINITSDTFEYVTVTGKTNNAAAVPEATTSVAPAAPAAAGAEVAAGGYKPESALALAVVTSPVETLAHWIPITRRAAADAPQVRGLIDAFLMYGLAEEEEDQILNGNGTSPNLRGILQTVGISTVGSAGTDIDAVVDAIAAIRAERRRPNAIVVNPADWYSTGFLTAKDTAGNYILGDPRATIEQLNTLWGLRVLVTEAQTANTLLVGDFKQAVLADRQQSTIYVTDSHADFFIRNILVVLAEERLGFGVLDNKAFCTVTAV